MDKYSGGDVVVGSYILVGWVLLQAIKDWSDCHPGRGSKEWIDTVSLDLWGFDWCCEVLDLDPVLMRGRIPKLVYVWMHLPDVWESFEKWMVRVALLASRTEYLSS
jgi:hypothetical protein